MLPTDPQSLADAVVAGDRRALARVVTLIEDGAPGHDEIVALLHRRGGGAHIVGITGSPGAGKSTLTDRLVAIARDHGESVAVLAVDPSSPFTGGAILGDRIRMQDHVSDPGVYVRSMATRGHLGGIAVTTGQVVTVLDAAGFDRIFVETVGVGQSEIDVMEVVSTTVLVLAPGWGDGIQAAKAGVLEAGDVFVVNKSDRGGAAAVAADLQDMLTMGDRGGDSPVLVCSSSAGEGVEEVWGAIVAHGDRRTTPEGRQAERRRVEASVRRALVARLTRTAMHSELEPSIVDDVIARRIDPWAAAAAVTDGGISESG